ncbi:MAG: lipopolysaccharide heptosyltransferase I [bacterium]
MDILIVKLSSLGDVIHCLPCLEALREGFPGARIDWVVEEQNAGILEGHPHIDRLIILSRKSWIKAPWRIRKVSSEIKGFLGTLRQREYDMVIDFQGLFRSGLIVGMSRGKRKIGFDRVREKASLFYNEKVTLSTLDQHAVTRYLEIPRYLGVHVDEPRFFLPSSEKDEDTVNRLLEDIKINTNENNKIIFINPNARWSSKIWPWEHFRELVRILSDNGYLVLLIGGPGDKDSMEQAFQGLCDKVYNLAGKTSLKSLAALFRRGCCLVTNDSGPMHLAVAVGLPVIALFGPSHPLRTGPFGWEEGKRSRVLTGNAPCAPCYRRNCSDQDCLKGISVHQVVQALEDLLDSRIDEKRGGEKDCRVYT